MLTFLLAGLGIAVAGGALWLFLRSSAGLGGGPRFPPGTRAFESEMTLPILAQMISMREIELQGPIDEDMRAELTTQIANMRKQTALHQAVVDAGDVSPGKNSIGVNPDSDQI